MKRLILLRHAKAERTDGMTPDDKRALDARGVQQAQSVGKVLGAEFAPDLALVSAAKRTRETFKHVLPGLTSPCVEERHRELYLAPVFEVLDLLREVDDTHETVLIVGHEPTMSATAARLAGPGSNQSALFQVHSGLPTAAFAVLEADLSWSGWGSRCAKLVAVRQSGA